MKTNRELRIEQGLAVTALTNALTELVEGEWGRPAGDYATRFAVAWVLFLIQRDFFPEERAGALNYETLFERSEIGDVCVQYYLKNNLGADIEKLGAWIDRYPQELLQVWLEMMGINIKNKMGCGSNA